MIAFSEFYAFVSSGGQADTAMGASTGNRPWENLAEHQNLYNKSGASLNSTARELQEAKETEAKLEAKEK